MVTTKHLALTLTLILTLTLTLSYLMLTLTLTLSYLMITLTRLGTNSSPSPKLVPNPALSKYQP